MGDAMAFLKVFSVLFTLCAGAQAAFGSGFALMEGSTRANALGHAMVGRADDPSALFFNPAGITQLPGLQILGGTTLAFPKTDVGIRGPRGETAGTEDNVFMIPHFYATYQFSERLWLGLGFSSPFGLGTEFDDDWPGRYNSYNALVQSLNINPNIAIKINDQLSLAAGFDIMWFDLTLEAKVPTGPPTPLPAVGDIDRSLKADSFGYGYNLGMRYRPMEWLAVGVSYRSEVTQDLEGKIDFDKPAGLPATFFRDTDVSGSTTLPDMLFTGLTFYPTKQLSVEVGAVWTHWSNFSKLEFKMDTPPIPGRSAVSSTPKNWHDVWRLQFGIEHKTTPWLDLRAGYAFDEEAIPDEHVDYILPVNDRHFFCLGSGVHLDNWAIDVSYNYVLIEERDVTARPAQGILDSQFRNGQAHLIALSLGYKF